MANQQQQPVQRTASQRIDDLERGLISLYGTADNMARDLGIIKDAIRLLGNKMDSIVKLTVRGEEVNDVNIAKVMVENNMNELKEKVDRFIEMGALVKADVVAPDSFIVGREVAEDGTVQNPRMQFVLSGSPYEQAKIKLPGSKVGDVVVVEEGKWKFEIQEIYTIQEPKLPEAQAEAAPAPEATAQEAAPAPEQAPAAPAAPVAAATDGTSA